MDKPNLFSIATKELSQDAFITWLLQWADPKYKGIDLDLHEIGKTLLKSLIAKQNPEMASNIIFNRVEAGRKDGHKAIDVWVKVNNEIFLIIEDKTNTKEHGNQIEVYSQRAKQYLNQNGTPWKIIIPIYFKTGNECINSLLAKKNCGIFSRQDILKVLPAQNSNHILQDFTENLQRVEDETNAYLNKSSFQWKTLTIQGFYCDLQKRFNKETLQRDEDRGSKLEYVPRGNFQALYWHFNVYKPLGCKIYLLIEGKENKQPELFLKGQGLKGGQEKLESKHMYQIFKDFESFVNSNNCNILVSKAGNFRGGKWGSSIAKIYPKGHNSFIKTDTNGLIDMENTTKFLFEVENLITSMCGQLS